MDPAKLGSMDTVLAKSTRPLDGCLTISGLPRPQNRVTYPMDKTIEIDDLTYVNREKNHESSFIWDLP